VVEHIEGKDALVVWRKKLVLTIARKDIVLNQQYTRDLISLIHYSIGEYVMTHERYTVDCDAREYNHE